LLLGLAVLPGLVQQPDQRCAQFFFIRRQSDESTGMREGTPGLPLETPDQFRVQGDAVAQNLLALGHAPGMKVMKILELQALEKITAVAPSGGFQFLVGSGLEPLGDQPAQAGYVDIYARGIHRNGRPVRHDPAIAGVVDQSPQLGQAPAK
jgi:hypothetical protein